MMARIAGTLSDNLLAIGLLQCQQGMPNANRFLILGVQGDGVTRIDRDNESDIRERPVQPAASLPGLPPRPLLALPPAWSVADSNWAIA